MKANSAIPETQVAVVIPAYRAAAHIAGVLRGIPEFVAWIIVVDDCSPDDAAAIVEEQSRRDPRIRLLRHAENQGVGGAVLTGYAEAHRLGAEIVVKMDGDGQMDPAHLPALIAPLLRGEADYAKGNRYLHARQLRAMPLPRRLGNLGLSFLTKLASGYWNIFDPTNGYTAIHASLVPLLDQEAIGRRYFFESSMLLELSLLRAVVRDVYIPARYGDETSNLSIIKTLSQFPAALLKGFCRRVWIQYVVRDFSIASLYAIAGLALLLSGGVFGAIRWCSSAQQGVTTPTGTVMLAALPVLLGIQLLLQAVSLDIQNQPMHCLHRDAPANQETQPTAFAPPPLPIVEQSKTRLPRQRAA
jgi:glycosyltransferase involved in cell wall biosynthesis